MTKSLYMFAVLVFIFGGLAFAVDITNCQAISFPGEYNLVNNIVNSSPCLEIASSDVILDCQGYSISSVSLTSNPAIFSTNLNSPKNLIIRNCVINNRTGIDLFNINNSLIENNIVINPVNGIKISRSNYFQLLENITIRNNTIRDRTTQFSSNLLSGIYLSNAKDSSISNNTLTSIKNYISGTIPGDSYGIRLLDSYSTNVTKNYLFNTAFDKASPEAGSQIEISGENILVQYNDISENATSTISSVGFGIYNERGNSVVIDSNNITKKHR